MKKKLLLFTSILGAITLNAQVTLVKEINDNGASSSNPSSLTVFDGKIFFTADDSNGSNTPGGADLGKELWITDGTEAGTTFVKDIRPGSDGSSPLNLFTFNNQFYFTAYDGNTSELWTSDGTETGTTKVDIMPSIFGESPQRFVELNGMAYFTVGSQPGTGAETTNKLVEWDGTNDAVQVADSGTGYESITADMIAFNNLLFIYMNYSTDDATYGRELYTYNPGTDTFTLVKDIDAGDGNSSISNFTIIGSELFFKADNALWKTDGTTAGTVAITNAASLGGINNLYAWNGKLFFEGDDGTNGDQLYVLDPISNSVTNLSNISGTNNDHDPSDYAEYNGYLYYRGEDANDNKGHLFRTNGTTIEQLDNSIIDIDEVTVLNDILYFEGDNDTTGNELYSFDPSTLSISNTNADIINVFPNPATEYIMVPKSLIKADYVIHDITGKKVSEGIITSEKIDISLNSGMYLFNVKTDVSSITKKILVK